MSWKTIALVLLAFFVAVAIIVAIAILIPTNMM